MLARPLAAALSLSDAPADDSAAAAASAGGSAGEVAFAGVVEGGAGNVNKGSACLDLDVSAVAGAGVAGCAVVVVDDGADGKGTNSDASAAAFVFDFEVDVGEEAATEDSLGDGVGGDADSKEAGGGAEVASAPTELGARSGFTVLASPSSSSDESLGQSAFTGALRVWDLTRALVADDTVPAEEVGAMEILLFLAVAGGVCVASADA